jgi:galactose-1-phosphate uridylyltransferase
MLNKEYVRDGRTAGTSLAHPHSQVVAMPIIPLHIRQKYAMAVQHYGHEQMSLMETL